MIWLPSRYRKKIKICPERGCWLWQGELNRNGYGRAYHKGIRHMAHKLVWSLCKGIWLTDTTKELDHLCECRHCVNPRHMDLVTRQINLKRRYGKRRKTIDTR